MLPDWLTELIKPRPTCVHQLELLWPDLEVVQQAAVLELIKEVPYGQWLFQSIWEQASQSPSAYLRYRALHHRQHAHKESLNVLRNDPNPLVRSLTALRQPPSIMQPQQFWMQPQLNRLQLVALHPSPILFDRLLTYLIDHQLHSREQVSEIELASLILEASPGMLRFSQENLKQSADYMGEPLFHAFNNLWQSIPKLPKRAGYELLNRLPWQLDGRALADAHQLKAFRGLLKWGLEARLEEEYEKLPHELMKGLLCQPIALEERLIEYWMESVRWDLGKPELQAIEQLPRGLKQQRLNLLTLHKDATPAG